MLLIISAIITLILRYCLIRENRRRKDLSPDQYNREAGAKEPCDRVSQLKQFFAFYYFFLLLLISIQISNTIIDINVHLYRQM